MTERSLLARLTQLDACAVSDALDKIGCDGLAQGLTALTVERKISGKVITVTLGPDDGRATKRHLGTAAVEAANRDNVIVVAHAGRRDVAGWGGILSLAAHKNGVRGVIVDGACRDVDEARELPLPIYATNGTPRTARGRVIETGWNETVEICGVSVSSGDLVIADGSGIVFVPIERAEEVLAIAEMIVRKEQLMAAAVKDGTLVSEVMGGDYETMLKGNPASGQ